MFNNIFKFAFIAILAVVIVFAFVGFLYLAKGNSALVAFGVIAAILLMGRILGTI